MPQDDQLGQDQLGQDKAPFDHVYDRPDPRAYFRALGPLDYEIPQRAQPVVQTLLSALRADAPSDTRPLRVLDVCSSYGVNAALLRCDLELADLYARYTGPELDALDPDELAAADAAFYAGCPRALAVHVAGLDVAPNAIAYGRRAGLLDDGWAEDLEANDPSPALAAELARTDLVITTGGVGYITARTFDRLLTPRSGPPPWIAALVLRMFPYDDIAATLSRHGLVTEHLAGPSFPQRRFATADERDAALRDVTARGLDPTGLESEGRYYADLHLSRPTAAVAAQPLAELLAPVLASAG